MSWFSVAPAALLLITHHDAWFEAEANTTRPAARGLPDSLQRTLHESPIGRNGKPGNEAG